MNNGFSRLLLIIVSAFFLEACTTLSNAPATGSEVDTDVGLRGCMGCSNIKTFTSRTLQNDLYAVRDEKNQRTGQRIGASIRLMVSNRSASLKGGSTASIMNVAYAAIVARPEAHFFDGAVKTDVNHPYRFIVRIHHNSSFRAQSAYLVTDDDQFVPLPPVSLEGGGEQQDCFNAGCVWDEHYIVSAQVISRLVEQRRPLRIFVGDRVKRQVQSKDGLNPYFEIVPAGVFLSVAPEQLENFVASVRKLLLV